MDGNQRKYSSEVQVTVPRREIYYGLTLSDAIIIVEPQEEPIFWPIFRLIEINDEIPESRRAFMKPSIILSKDVGIICRHKLSNEDLNAEDWIACSVEQLDACLSAWVKHQTRNWLGTIAGKKI